MRATTFVFLTVVLWGIAPIFDKLGIARVRPEVATAIRSLTVFVGISCYLLAGGLFRQIASLDLSSLLCIAVGGVAAGLLAQVTYFYAMKAAEASRVVPMASSYPVVTLVLGILLLGEKLNVPKVLGTLMVVGGLYVIQLGRR
ncbi:MAG: EamA family transporter [Armatimonadota bacterium]